MAVTGRDLYTIYCHWRDVVPKSFYTKVLTLPGATIKVDSVKEILAGKLDQKTDVITIEEVVSGSLLANRKVTITLPDWVKITSWDSTTESSIDVDFNTPSDNKASISIKGASTGKAKLEFKLKLVVEANRTGDIEATISGAGLEAQKVVVAKAVAPVTVSASAVTDVSIGVRDQAVSDLTITEGKAGAIAENKDIEITLPEGVTFATTPTVKVESGDLELKEAVVESGSKLVIPVKTESFKASTIKISGIKLTVDRTVPAGALTAKIKGAALVEYVDEDEDYFITDYVAKVQLANCVVPGEQKAAVVFTINDTSYTVNGVEQTMDVAPYIKDGRTFVPVRYVAQALGVTPENILYADGKVTLIKGDKVVQLAIGSNVMLINGISIAMDVPAEIKDGRTMLPFRWVAQALGAKVNWDETTQTVTMEL